MELKKIWLQLIYLALLITGMIILINSIGLGKMEAHKMMQLNGGSMDTNTYLIYLEQSMIKYRWIAATLALLGGAGLIHTNQRS